MKKDIQSIFDVKNINEAADRLFFPSDELDHFIVNGYQAHLKQLKNLIYDYRPSYINNIVSKYRSNAPILSIVTSMYNGDKYVEGFMENICSQEGFELFEFIILNCNSPGNEDSVVSRYTSEHKNIQYIKLDYDPGLYEAWNIAIKRSTGRFISNANLDDRKSPVYYMLLLDWMINNNLDVSSSLFWTCKNLPEFRIDEEAIIWYKDHLKEVGFFDFFKISDDGEKIEDQCVMGPMPIWRRSLHSCFGFFDESRYGPSADYELWSRFLKGGASFGLYRVPLVFYLKVLDSYARRTNVLEFNSLIIRENFSSF